MTENVRIISIQTDNAVKNIQSLEAEADALKAKLSELKQGTDEYQQTLDSLVATEEKLKNSFSSLSNTIGELKSNFADLKKTFEGVEIKPFEGFDENTQKVIGDISNIVKNLDELKASIGETDGKSFISPDSDTQEILDGLKSILDTVNGLKSAGAGQIIEDIANGVADIVTNSEKINNIDPGKQINSVADLKAHIKELKDTLVSLDSGSEEYQTVVDELIASQTKLNEVMAVTRGAVSAQSGSYNALVNEMSALKTVWRATTSEVQRAQLGERIRAVNDQLKAYDESIGNHQRKVGSYEEALKVLNKEYDSQKQELAALKTAMDNLEPGTEAYNQAFTRAAEITHNLQERQEMLRKSADDLGTQLGNIMSIGTGLVSGFNAINAIMALTGQKNEDLQKTMVKLQAGIALVQSAKGLEGAVKSLKSYAQWAANVFDKIVNLISGQKKLQTQTQTTTVATEANAAANNANAVAETRAAAGADTLNVSMRNAAAGTTTATAAMTAFKAVLVSSVIGIVIAGISGLITLIGKLASTAKKAREQDMGYAELAIENEQKRVEDEIKEIERRAEASRAAGKSELEVLKELDDGYTKLFKKISASKAEAEKYSNSLQLKTGTIKDNEKKAKSMATQMLASVKYYTENGSRYMREMLINDQEFYDKLLKKGVKTYEELAKLSRWYVGVLKENQENFEIDPLAQNREDIENEAKSILTESKDALKSELELENQHYKEQRDNYKWSAEELETLRRAHWKRVTDIVTGATQSIIDGAKSANQTQLANLVDAEEKEIKELKKYYADKKKVTITTEEGITKVMTAEEAVRTKYAKERRKIELNETIKATERAIKEMQNLIGSLDAQKAYDQLQAAGVAKAKDLSASLEESFAYQEAALEQTVGYWKKILDEIENDESVSNDDRYNIQQKYIDASNALENARTKHVLDQIKVRKQALDEEIRDSVKPLEKRRIEMENQAAKEKANNTNFGSTFFGFAGNPTFEQRAQTAEDFYLIDRAKLEEELTAYLAAAEDVNRTDAERTYAQEQASKKRLEIMDLETQHIEETTQLQIDMYEAITDTVVSTMQSIGDILGTVADAWEDTVQTQLENNEISQEAAENEFDNIAELQKVQAVINMLAGSVGAFSQASATIPPPYGQIVGAAAAAAVIAQGIAQIVQIENAKKRRKADSISGAGASMAQVTPVFPDYQPQMTGNITGQQEVEELANAITKAPIWVSVKDIDDAQERGRVRVAEASF